MSNGPVVMSVAGDTFTEPARINMVIWKYKGSTAGDECVLTDVEDGTSLWEAVTDQSNTYLGGNFGKSGVHCPKGFRLSAIAGGKLFVYLLES